MTQETPTAEERISEIFAPVLQRVVGAEPILTEEVNSGQLMADIVVSMEEAITEAEEAMKERCAKVAEELNWGDADTPADAIAAAIRARGES
ncbi:hypothetical protein LCGC14_2164250 [marine sediment metagenome]|uniref:Uncharacterized protein n=1 Tax=marine sediment metagenome TaxID=412755 RepID=A0A0F9DRY2_9ZZZZ